MPRASRSFLTGRHVSLSCLAALVATTGAARADVSQPFGGVTLVSHAGHGSLLVVNLCAAGVSVRATRYGERHKKASEWGSAIGAQAAINGDFFDFPGWTWVAGRARGAGEDWPAGAQQHYANENRPYWQFGPALARFVDQNATGPDPGASELIGGHDTVIHAGQPITSFSDSFSLAKRPRTAIGISQDERTLFVFSTSDSLDLNQLSGVLIAHAQEAGGPAIHHATNEDGGGSSQMYVAGKGELVSTTRQVNNHLGIFASGSGASPQCNNQPPRGSLDQAGCDTITGWAQDPNTPDAPIATHLYFNAPVGAPGTIGVPITADQHRDDLCTAIGSCNHGFSYLSPYALFDGKAHEVHAYGIDSGQGNNPELGSKSLTCAPPKLTGVRRHVSSEAVLAAWKFSTFRDQATVTDAALATLADASDWPEKPAMIRAKGQPAVYLVDGTRRRHIPSQSVAANWNLDIATAVEKSVAEVEAIPEGTPLSARPLLVRSGGPAVYVVDDDKPGSAGAGGQGGAGGQSGPGGQGGASSSGTSGHGGTGTSGTSGQPGSAGRATGGQAGGGGNPTIVIHAPTEDDGSCRVATPGRAGRAGLLLALAGLMGWRRRRAR